MTEGDSEARGVQRPAASGPRPTDPVAPPLDGSPGHGAGRPAARFRRRRLALDDGTSLVLNPSGSIDHIDGAGAVVRTWNTADPGWGSHAIRFGIRSQEPTVAPTRRGLGAVRAPRW